MNGKFKIIRKKECYSLTWAGRLLLMLFILISLLLFVFRMPVFLSQSKPLNGQILVLDGIMNDFAIKEAIEIYESGNYKQIVVTGGDLQAGFYISDIKSMAQLSYATFIKLGFDSTKINCIPTGYVVRNRTYTSGQGLKDWLSSHSTDYNQIDILAIGCHAARSAYLFQLALGNEYEVGVIAVQDPSYDIKHWWKSSKGLRTVIGESLGYTYVRFFFFP